ncbi:MAG: hypothetical protein ACYC8T_09020 [Myxococcaceae bacterium]
MRKALIVVLGLLAAGCKSGPPTAGQGGAVFREPLANPGAGAGAMMDVCWPPDAAEGSAAKVSLTFFVKEGRLEDVIFEAGGGATNSVGRCIREVAWVYPWRPGEVPATLELTPPAQRPSGWAVLAYVRQISAMTYGDDRGVLDPAPLVRACLSHGLGARPQLLYRVETSPLVRVMTHASGVTGPVSDSERCVVAVLAATRYPGSRGFELAFPGFEGAPAAAPLSEVAAYFAPAGAEVSAGPIDPALAREALSLRGPQVAACWESALARRAGLSGGRSVRLRVGPEGEVQFAHVVQNQSNSPQEAADLLLDRCLVGAAAGARFQRTGTSGDVIYSWVFAQR